MTGTIISAFAVIGVIFTIATCSALLYLIFKGKLRPNMSFRNAMGEVRYDYSILIFVLPAAFFGGVKLGWEGIISGIMIGFAMILYLIILQWLMGPV